MFGYKVHSTVSRQPPYRATPRMQEVVSEKSEISAEFTPGKLSNFTAKLFAGQIRLVGTSVVAGRTNRRSLSKKIAVFYVSVKT